VYPNLEQISKLRTLQISNIRTASIKFVSSIFEILSKFSGFVHRPHWSRRCLIDGHAPGVDLATKVVLKDVNRVTGDAVNLQIM
jgi:hypothetical protein